MRRKPARTPRLYVEDPLRAGARLALAPRAAHHATDVLRLRAGEALVLFDGRGGEYDARILVAARERVEAEEGERRDVERESPRRVTLDGETVGPAAAAGPADRSEHEREPPG